MIASEPFIAAALAERQALRALLYAVIVGGLVAIPVSRALSPTHRFQVVALVAFAAWLAGFGWLDERLSAGIDPAGAWQWDESLIDFVRWIGWIPLVILLERWLTPNARRKATPR
jgi:hypothetical protein